MNVWQAILLGAVQGLTEFLPISSSAHLILVPKIFGWPEQGLAFDVAVHVATLGAIIVALRKDVVELIRGVRRGDGASRKLTLQLLVATVPAVVVGVAVGDALDQVRGLTIIGQSLIVWGILLVIADVIARRRTGITATTKVKWWQALVIGFIQVLAFIPGTSRSGATMTAGLFSGLDRPTAARFSFLLAIPAIAGAGAKTAFDAWQNGLDVPVAALMAGCLSAFVFGILAIRLLLLVVRKFSFVWFAAYRILLGVLLIYLAMR